MVLIRSYSSYVSICCGPPWTLTLLVQTIGIRSYIAITMSLSTRPIPPNLWECFYFLLEHAHLLCVATGGVHPDHELAVLQAPFNCLSVHLVPVSADPCRANRSHPTCVSACASYSRMCIWCGSSRAAFTWIMSRSYYKHQFTKSSLTTPNPHTSDI